MQNTTQKPEEVKRSVPSGIKRVEFDEFGDYKLQYPLRNWNYDGPTRIPYFKPIWRRLQFLSENSFASNMASVRSDLNYLLAGNVIVTLATIAVSFKAKRLLSRAQQKLVPKPEEAIALSEQMLKMRNYVVVPLSASYFYSYFLYDLAYGDMTTRINTEFHRIMSLESVAYFTNSEEYLVDYLKQKNVKN